MNAIFDGAQWIWGDATRQDAYVAFVRKIELPPGQRTPYRIRITASTYYELFIDGNFIARGPVYGDPQWCLYDELTYTPTASTMEVVIVAHWESLPQVIAVRPAPGGVLASFVAATHAFGTDASWKCLPLTMWAPNTPKRGWALGAGEDYDAHLEPEGWQDKRFPAAVYDASADAIPVPEPDTIWGGYQARPTPYLHYAFVPPVRCTASVATGLPADTLPQVGTCLETEPLDVIATDVAFTTDTLNALLQRANAFTFDLSREYIGHVEWEIDAPEGRVLDIAGAELLREGRPWIVRKGAQDTVRYRTRHGRQVFHSFGWSGFRYLHLVIRGGTEGISFRRIGCRQRSVPLQPQRQWRMDDTRLQAIFELCQRTLEVGTQEHLIDCPTREQAQYWGDAVFIAQSLWHGFGEESYLRWYLDAYLQAPLNAIGQLSSVYPGHHATLLDYSLIPLLGQRFYQENTGQYYRAAETCEKALLLKAWYDARRTEEGLLRVPAQERIAGIDVINFIDHPGLGWHDFPHVGIDREGVSCPLNLFYFAFLTILADLLASVGEERSHAIRQQATTLGTMIQTRFFDGSVFHDAWNEGILSTGTSWQTNCLAVYFGLVTGEVARIVMQTMLDRYDTVCRCSPYFHFYFLFALRSVGLHEAAIELIQREWQPMLDAGATTTWEGFGGDAKDSLCHPWSTAPFLYLITG